ncbi:MAG: 50S ribosomal protein L4, partial [Pseudomonadota bacterium]
QDQVVRYILRPSYAQVETLRGALDAIRSPAGNVAVAGSVLIITDNLDENLYLASRNLPNVAVVEPRHADPLSLVHYKKVLVTKAAVAQIEELLK